MKIHRIIVEQVVLALEEIFSTEKNADKVIEKYLKSHKKWGSRDRKLFAESVYEITRWWRLLWTILGEEPSVRHDALLRLWGVWRLRDQHDVPAYPEFENLDPQYIRKFAANKLPRTKRESIPDWMDQRGLSEFPEAKWDAIITALNQKASVYLRVNTLKTTKEKAIEALATEDILVDAVPNFDSALKLRERKNVFSTECFKKGFFEVQDAASQRVAELLSPEPGDRVIDACAGAGGKALHLAALMKNKGKIIAMDIHSWRLDELKRRARRAGVDIAETRVIDSNKVIKRMKDTADKLLLDVPCSGLGVLRRNPDAKWKLSNEEIDRLCELQKQILDDYSVMLKKNGIMVYATCSILPSENEKQIEAFLDRHPNQWVVEKQLRLDPDQEGLDGFFAARLKKIGG